MDFAALASRMAAGLDGVRACLIVSADGLSLGAYPENAEAKAKSVWDRLSTVGDPQRGFFNVGDELWVVARRGWYAALLIASPSVRPGIALDRLESYLKIAEESRVREATEIGPPAGPARRLRTPLHREPKAEPRPEPQQAPEPKPAQEPAPAPAAGTARPVESFAFGPQAAAPAPPAPPAPPRAAPPPPPPPAVVSPEPEPMTPVSPPLERPVSERVAEAPAPPQPEPPAPSVSPQPEPAPAAPEARVESPAQDETTAVAEASAPPVEAPVAPPEAPVVPQSPPAPVTPVEEEPFPAPQPPPEPEPEPEPEPQPEPEPEPEPEVEPMPEPAAKAVPVAVVEEPQPEPRPAEPSESPAEPEPQPEPGRVVLDMTGAEPSPVPASQEEPDRAEVKDQGQDAEDASETRHAAEVDRVALTREFAQLFADMEGRDES